MVDGSIKEIWKNNEFTKILEKDEFYSRIFIFVKEEEIRDMTMHFYDMLKKISIQCEKCWIYSVTVNREPFLAEPFARVADVWRTGRMSRRPMEFHSTSFSVTIPDECVDRYRRESALFCSSNDFRGSIRPLNQRSTVPSVPCPNSRTHFTYPPSVRENENGGRQGRSDETGP